MKFRLKVIHKILIPFLIILIITFIVISIININAQTSLIEGEEQKSLSTFAEAFQSLINDKENTAVALAQAFAKIPEVQEAFAN